MTSSTPSITLAAPFNLAESTYGLAVAKPYCLFKMVGTWKMHGLKITQQQVGTKSTPDYSHIFGFSDLNYNDWKRDVALAHWTLNEINGETSLRSYTWLVPRKRGDTYVRFSNSAWSAAGTLMWGNNQYTVNNSKFSSGSLDPEFANRIKSEGRIRVFFLGESKDNVATAKKDIIQSDVRIEVENCTDFKDGLSPIYVCGFTLASS